jgi:hypothetical protein
MEIPEFHPAQVLVNIKDNAVDWSIRMMIQHAPNCNSGFTGKGKSQLL